jgi:DNA-binding CsgD family transcriptional regulator
VIPRRRFPVTAFAAVAVLGALQIALGQQPGSMAPVPALQPSVTDLAIPVLLYTLAAHRPRRISVAALTVCLLGAAVAVSQWAPAHRPYPGVPLLAASVALGGSALVAWVLGDSVAYRHRRIHYASLEERAARLEAERDAQARIAAAAERARELQEQRARVVDASAARLRRIERDLHDGAQVRLTALLDPEVVRHLLGAARRADSLAALTPREREVLSLIAQGRSNAAIAERLSITPGVVEKHVAGIFAKLGLAPSNGVNRRVVAALRYLGP